MQLHDPRTEFEGNLPNNRKTFQLKSNPKMFKILSDGIYADKISAVIRELSCNAYDSTVVAKSRKFIVNVPTSLDPTFFVEDFGTGIDPDKIVDIFWTYGESTKTKSNDQIGALGLGSKSPFAYTKSSFGVRNRYNGVEHTYFCFINEDGIPDGSEIAKGPTVEPNGVRVELAVKLEDIRAFRERIIRFFSFWDPKNLPEFHGDSSVLDEINRIHSSRTLSGSNWQLRSSSESAGGRAYAVMGGVPYPINRQALPGISSELAAICDAPINIVFPIGALDFQVSREELAYEDVTIRALESVAKGICNELMINAKAKLVGFSTPFELAIAFYKVKQETSERLRFVANLLDSSIFALTDGREFTGRQLQRSYVTVSVDGHLPINVMRIARDERTYTKGQQNYSVESKTMLTLVNEEQVDPVTKAVLKPRYANTLDWFRPDTKPVKQTNMHRRRTAANYLEEGYKVTSTSFETRNNEFRTRFIINDIGERGVEGIRFYRHNLYHSNSDPILKPLSVAFNDGSLYFVDGFGAGKNAAETEAELRKLLNLTLLEGVPVTYLSKLPDFALPTAPKVEPKPRAPQQRGTTEIRMGLYTIEAQEFVCTVEEFDVKIRKASSHVNTYLRHKLDQPLLYVETTWGNPRDNLDKKLVTNEVIGAFNMLGLFDGFLAPHPTSKVADAKELRIGMLPAATIEDLKQRGVKLIPLRTLAEQAVKLFAEDVELVAAFQARPAGEVYDEGRVILNRLMNKAFIRHVLPKLNPNNQLAQLANIKHMIAGLVRGNARRIALMYLCFSAFENLHIVRDLQHKLKGKRNIDDIVTTYALIEALSRGLEYQRTLDDVTASHMAMYINNVDEMIAKKAEAKRQEFLAQLEAESIFSDMHQPE